MTPRDSGHTPRPQARTGRTGASTGTGRPGTGAGAPRTAQRSAPAQGATRVRTQSAAAKPAQARTQPAATAKSAKARTAPHPPRRRRRALSTVIATQMHRLAQARRDRRARRTTRVGPPERRSRWLSVVGLIAFAVVIGKLTVIQTVDAPALAADALAQRTRQVEIPAARGSIVDVNGTPLATSVTRYDVSVNQREIAAWEGSVDDVAYSGVAGAAELTADLLQMSVADLVDIYTGDAQFAYVKKGVLPEVWTAIKALGIHGLYADQVSARVHPSGDVASSVIGITGADGNGLSGLEYSYQDVLAGTPGTTSYELGGTGQEIPAGSSQTTEAVDGGTIRLTIDRDIQYVAQSALEKRIAEMGADGGWAAVMDVSTGAVLAMAESTAAGSELSTRMVSDVFEPGSTAKVITMAALLETGTYTPTSEFTVPDRYTTSNGQEFQDSHDHAAESWTLTGILSNSSNTGTVMAGSTLSPQVRYDYLKKFGFGDPTGIEIGGESAGILHPVDQWDGRTQYTVLFGQGVSVTALQMMSVFATVGNDGQRTTPHIVADITQADGSVDTTAPTVGDQVISKETADQLLTMMESTVTDGTGVAAAIPGYRVAGKTGTAQAADATGKMDDIVASFVGIVPADSPQLVVAVALKNPRATIYGGDAAGPVFSQVGQYALQKMGVVPSTSAAALYPETWGTVAGQ